MADTTEWEGTATEFLAVLTDQAGDAAKDRTWPKAGHVLSGHLKRLTPNLRRLGIGVETGIKESGGQRRLTRLRTLDQHSSGSERPERPERPSLQNGAIADRSRASEPGAGASQADGQASH